MKDHNELLLFFIIIVFVLDIDCYERASSYTIVVTKKLIFANAKGLKAFSMRL